MIPRRSTRTSYDIHNVSPGYLRAPTHVLSYPQHPHNLRLRVLLFSLIYQTK